MAAATSPQSGFGVQVSWRGHDIGYLLDVDYSGASSSTIDLGSHESRIKTFVGGMVDMGEVTLPIHCIPGDTTGQKTLWADIKTQTSGQVVITLPDATTMTFTGIPTKFGDFTFPVEGSIEAVIVIKVTGDNTFTGYA